MPTVLQIQHVTVIVDNLERACAFYEGVLGLQPLPTFNLDFPAQFFRVNERQQIHVSEWPDTPAPWGKVRQLPDGAMQMFVRDPAGNLIELSCAPGTPVDEAILGDELSQGQGVYVANRDDGRGLRGDGATLYHERSEP